MGARKLLGPRTPELETQQLPLGCLSGGPGSLVSLSGAVMMVGVPQSVLVALGWGFIVLRPVRERGGLSWWVRQERILLQMQETQVQSLDQEDPLAKGMATHSNILAWGISWTEPGRLQSMGSQRVRHN